MLTKCCTAFLLLLQPLRKLCLLKALTLPTILKIPDVTVPDMTVITELQEQVAKNHLFSYLGGGTDEPSDTTE